MLSLRQLKAHFTSIGDRVCKSAGTSFLSTEIGLALSGCRNDGQIDHCARLPAGSAGIFKARVHTDRELPDIGVGHMDGSKFVIIPSLQSTVGKMGKADAIVRDERNSACDKLVSKTNSCIDGMRITILDTVLTIIFLMGIAQVCDDIDLFAGPCSVKVDTIPMRVKL